MEKLKKTLWICHTKTFVKYIKVISHVFEQITRWLVTRILVVANTPCVHVNTLVFFVPFLGDVNSFFYLVAYFVGKMSACNGITPLGLITCSLFGYYSSTWFNDSSSTPFFAIGTSFSIFICKLSCNTGSFKYLSW